MFQQLKKLSNQEYSEKYSHTSEAELIALKLWTSNIIYKRLNKDLGVGNDSNSNNYLVKWGVFLKFLHQGL